MPDIRPATSYIGKIRRLEAKYLAEIDNARLGFRRNALDILTRYGVRLSNLYDIRSEISALERQISSISRAYIPQVDELVLWYMNQQLGNLRRVGETGLPNIQQLNLSTYSERLQIYENTLVSTPAWINNLAKNMETNITRLAIADAEIETAIDRLLSVSIADGRASIWRLSGAAAITETAETTWTAAILAASGLFKATQTITRTEYMKQAIAAIDAVTTDCCLRVHGQTQPLDKPFELIGTPRFADRIDNPPFHWSCRTATSLYTVQMENKGITTPQMKEAAEAELKARERTGRREEIWPAHATSRRNRG